MEKIIKTIKRPHKINISTPPLHLNTHTYKATRAKHSRYFWVNSLYWNIQYRFVTRLWLPSRKIKLILESCKDSRLDYFSIKMALLVENNYWIFYHAKCGNLLFIYPAFCRSNVFVRVHIYLTSFQPCQQISIKFF